MQDLVKQAEQISAHSDRYLFILTLLVMGLGGALVIRYLVRTIEKMNAEHQSDHKACEDKLQAIVASQNDSRERLIVVTEQNSQVIRDCTAQLIRIKSS